VVSGVAHAAQNFAFGGFSVPHWGQRRKNGAAHSTQNFAPSGLSPPQLAQRMPLFYCIDAGGTRSASLRFSMRLCRSNLRRYGADIVITQSFRDAIHDRALPLSSAKGSQSGNHVLS
jgi:hypothetical protein